MSPAKRPEDPRERNRQNKARRDAQAKRSANQGQASGLAAPRATETGGGGTTRSTAPRGTRPARGVLVPGAKMVQFAFVAALASLALPFITKVEFEKELPRREVTAEMEIQDETDTSTATSTDDETDSSVDPNEEVTVTYKDTIPNEVGLGVTAGFLSVPILLCGGAWYLTRSEKRVRYWTIAMFLLLGWFVLASSFAFSFLPSMVTLAIATYQGRRAEQEAAGILTPRQRRQQAAEQDAAEDEPADDVIDVDEVTDASEQQPEAIEVEERSTIKRTSRWTRPRSTADGTADE